MDQGGSQNKSPSKTCQEVVGARAGEIYREPQPLQGCPLNQFDTHHRAISTGCIPANIRDLRPVASVISDYSCFAVHPDSDIQSFEDLVSALSRPQATLPAVGRRVIRITSYSLEPQLAGIDP